MGRGPLLTTAEKTEIWTRRGRGEPVWMIARHMGRSRRAVSNQVRSTGGVPPHKPERSRRELTIEEREELSRGLAVGESCRALAIKIGRASSARWDGHRRRSRARCVGMEAENAIGRRKRMKRLSGDGAGPSRASWRSRHGCAPRWRPA